LRPPSEATQASKFGQNKMIRFKVALTQGTRRLKRGRPVLQARNDVEYRRSREQIRVVSTLKPETSFNLDKLFTAIVKQLQIITIQ